MAGTEILLKYLGGDADKHTVDMRQLGQSLQGADRIMSDGLIEFIHRRPPKRAERAPVLAKVTEPKAGSYEFGASWEAAAGLLPLAAPIAETVLGSLIEHWWEAAKAKFTGNTDLMERQLETLERIHHEQVAARIAEEERSHERQMALIDAMKETLSAQQRAIDGFVAPVGRSVEQVRVSASAGEPFMLRTEDADEIRERAKVHWTELAEIRLKTDGFKFHSNGLSIEHPDKEGYLMAKVSDPEFDELENKYT